MASKRTTVTAIAVAGLLSLGVAAGAEQLADHRPRIRFTPGTPQDVQALARATWTTFTEAFRARWECFGDITVAGAWHLDERADYDPSRRLATVRIPGTPTNLRESLVHEFAHHVDFSCPAMASVHRSFLAAQGLPLDAPWSTGPTWEGTPSEQFAEATVAAVLGRTAHPRILLSRKAIEVVRTWAARKA